LLDVDESVFPVDLYNVDVDEDRFIANPGLIPTILIPVYDPNLAGWIDCDDESGTVFPEFVTGDDCI